jgi:hypothetical protein
VFLFFSECYDYEWVRLLRAMSASRASTDEPCCCGNDEDATMSATKRLLQRTIPPAMYDALRVAYRPVRAAQFLFAKHIAGYAVPDAPWFDAPGMEFYLSRIRDSKIYLEYGSGGSTVHAAQVVDVLVSVDSDPYFLRAVEKGLARQPGRPDCHLIYSDIGLTGPWGTPVARKLSKRRLEKWRRYSELPWALFREKEIEPDTILIDGRFRVACALESLANLSLNSQTLLLFDDYIDRAYYHAIESFAQLIFSRGRMGVLVRRTDFDTRRCREAIEVYCRDWR